MSANASDEALQRLNYFNGQRLAAADFRAEQDHHVAMRRVLNRSLYSPGIVAGLEVVPDPKDQQRVIVQHGLAFDNLGREIFLPADVSVQVVGAPSSVPGVVFGNLLVVSYREMRRFPVQTACQIGAPYQPCSGDLAWGAPTRVVADAVFEFLDSWPSDDSGKVVLSQVELNKGCRVERTSPSVRRYAVPARPQTVRPLSLEGEKDIDHSNSKLLFFHVDGGAPEAAVLYLRGRQFSTLYYTELGRHSHAVTLKDIALKATFAHTIDPGTKTAAGEGEHRHTIRCGSEGGAVTGSTPFDMREGTPESQIMSLPESFNPHPIVQSGSHQHTIDALSIKDHVLDTTLKFEVSDPGATGADDLDARQGHSLNSLADLVIKFDGIDITSQVCDQLDQIDAQSGMSESWRLDAGGGRIRVNGKRLNEPLGAGPIDLLKLDSVDLSLGQHTLEFIVSDDGMGGKIQYNLYIA